MVILPIALERHLTIPHSVENIRCGRGTQPATPGDLREISGSILLVGLPNRMGYRRSVPRYGGAAAAVSDVGAHVLAIMA